MQSSIHYIGFRFFLTLNIFPWPNLTVFVTLAIIRNIKHINLPLHPCTCTFPDLPSVFPSFLPPSLVALASSSLTSTFALHNYISVIIQNKTALFQSIFGPTFQSDYGLFSACNNLYIKWFVQSFLTVN